MSRIGLVVPTLGLRRSYLLSAVRSACDQGADTSIAVVVAVEQLAAVQHLLADLDCTVIGQVGEGISAAIAQGWRASEDAEYVAWLGDDDVLRPNGLVVAANALNAKRDASAAVGRCDVIDESGLRLFTMASGRPALWLQRYGHNLVMQPGAMFRRVAVEAVGGLDANLRYAMDYDLLLRLRRWGPIVYVPRSLAAFRWHERSTTVANSRESFAEAAAVRRRYWRGAWWEPAAEKVATTASKPVYWAARRRVPHAVARDAHVGG